ncbi:hypothetical protein D9M71_668700 [compost metagenome]
MTIQANLCIQLATGHAKSQRLKTEHAIGEHQVRVEIIEGQLFAVDDALPGEFDIRVHVTPAIGLELFDRQYLVRWLLALATAGFLLGIGVGADQRCQVGEQQLVG